MRTILGRDFINLTRSGSSAPTARSLFYKRTGAALGRGPQWAESRVLVRPQPGFYAMRLRHDAPVVAALIYQSCPMVIPQPTAFDGPHPDEWCRPLDRSPQYSALIDGKRVPINHVWTARSLRPVSPEEYEFRMGPLRRWARANPAMPEARPEERIDLAALPPLF